jgi:hypothetical protein
MQFRSIGVIAAWAAVAVVALVGLVGSWGCGDDDVGDGPGRKAPPSAALEDLVGAELTGLCEQLLARVRDVSTPEQQCVEVALASESTTSACDSARKACVRNKEYTDFEKARCNHYGDTTSDVDPPMFRCEVKVSAVTSCYDKVAKWLEGLRCSQAGEAPAIPSCIDELSDGACKFALSKLLEGGPAGDAGDGSLSCEPGKKVSCLCSGDAERGTQACNRDGIYDPCVCGSASGGSAYSCKSGDMTYPYDFGVSAACNECATTNCCVSYAQCESDEDCACYWECLGKSGVDDCFGPCGITDYPDAFVDHASCLRDSCSVPCELQ